MNKSALLWSILIITVCLISGGSDMALADPMNKEIAFQNQLQFYRKIYIKESGKQPTYENLIKSIKMENRNGLNNSEIIDALNLLIMEKENDKTLVPDIVACYNKNSRWLIRVLCAEILLDLEEGKGVELAKKIINDPQADLEAKLSMSRSLVKKGKLFAYPVLREGFMTPKKYLRITAQELLEEYRPYDGKVWDEKSDKKINIAQLMKDVNIKVSTNKTDVGVEPIECIAETNLNLKVDDSGKTKAVSATNTTAQ
jgi:hypothetical protein